MPNFRNFERVVSAKAVSEGAGVTVHRMIGVSQLPNLDPFLMLDHFGSDKPDQYIAGFPNHPHRGFITLTYMLDGQMQHRDSMGNEGNLGPGSAQWMKAASGVIHSEMPKQKEGLMRGFQLWINLPASQKMTDPEYQEITSTAIPIVKFEGGSLKVLAGEFADIRGPITDPNTDVRYFDVTLQPGAQFGTAIPNDFAAFISCYEGGVSVGGQELGPHQLAVLSKGEQIDVRSGPEGAKLILVAGRPIREPIVQYGPFVMNTRAEIEKAFADYQNGNLVQKKADFREKR